MSLEHLAIRASAGSGKTFRLALRYIDLLNRGKDPGEIVAMTFTNKAAGEILTKIVRILLEWLDNPGSRDEMCAKFLGRGMGEEEVLGLLKKMTSSLHRIRIGTLDSFFFSVVNNFPFECGISGRIEMLNERDDSLVRMVIKKILADKGSKEVFLDLCKRAGFGDSEKSLFETVKALVTKFHQQYLRLKDGGRWGGIPQLVDECKGLRPLTEERKREIEAGFESLLKEADFKGSAPLNNYLRLMRASLNYDKIPSLGQKKPDMDYYTLFLEADDGGDEVVVEKNRSRAVFTGEALDMCREIMANLKLHELRLCMEAGKAIHDIIKRYEDDYSGSVRSFGRLTFGDILYLLGDKSLDLEASDREMSDRLYIDYRLDSRSNHWLLDEFQDTSVGQWKVIENLISEVMQSDDGGRTFFYVGDVKQSIYQWRGGNPKLFDMLLKEDYRGRIRCERLNCSYRSSPMVIDTVNEVFSKLGCIRRDDGSPLFDNEKVLGPFGWEPHEAAERNKDKPGFAALIQYPEFARGEAEEKFQAQAAAIHSLIKSLDPAGNSESRPVSVGILGLKNDFLTDLADYLKDTGGRSFDVSVEGEFQVNDSMFTAAFLSMTRLAAHPSDKRAMEHLRMLRLWERADGDNELARLLRGSKDWKGAADAGRLSDWSRRTAGRKGFEFLVESWRDAFSGGVRAFDDERARWLAEAACECDAKGAGDIDEFLREIESKRVRTTSSSMSVQLLTVHKSKGLEYDAVIIPDLGSRAHPISRSLQTKEDANFNPEWAFLMPQEDIVSTIPFFAEFIKEKTDDELYEGLCKLYVAMTRAKSAMYILVEPPRKNPAKNKRHDDILRETLPGPAGDEALAWFSEVFGTKPDAGEESFSLLHAHGDPWWRKRLPGGGVSAREVSPLDDDGPLEADFHGGTNHVAPSKEEKTGFPGGGPFMKIDGAGRDLGTAAHELFSRVEWLGGDSPGRVAEEWIKEASPRLGAELAGEVARLFVSAFDKPAVRELFTRPAGGEVEVWRERGFSIMLDNGDLLGGAFDRVVVRKAPDGAPESAEITDFKTDKAGADPSRRGELEEKYRPQLKLYAEAAARLLNLPPGAVRKRLLLVRSGETLEL